MDLLGFYLESIFYFFEFPTASDICVDSGNITYLCKSVINFTLVYFCVMLAFSIYLGRNLQAGVKFLLYSILAIITCFFFADKILTKIANPATFGMELFVVSFYFWGFLISLALLSALFYYEKRVKILIPALAITLFSIFLFSLFGRGTYEQYLVLTGSINGEYTIENFLYSDLARMIISFFAVTLFYGLFLLAYHWIKKGEILPKLFFRGFPLSIIISLLTLFSLVSLPVGDVINESDVANAKNYIDEIKKNVDKYYLENDEYPRFISDYIDDSEQENPWLLKRQEYFTMGVRGTYYFSRAHKYCFIFQNPASDFSYFSMTSSRGWNKYNDNERFGNVYLEMCDEGQENEEELFAGHLGLRSPDDPLTSIYYDFNSPDLVPESKEATTILHEKIKEYGDKVDPEIFKYYKDNISE